MALNSMCKNCGTGLGPEDNDGANTQPEKCTRCRRLDADLIETNPFAAAGRARKVLAMVSVIDDHALRKKPPINPFDQAGRILAASIDWPDQTWELIGVKAGYKPKAISPKTREEVRRVYRGRATAPLTNRRAS